MNLKYTVLFSLLCISACSKDMPPPHAEPLNATAEQLAQIPRLNLGEYKVIKSAALQWQLGETELRLRVVEPQGAGPFPLLIFSHGFASDIDKYDALFEHWASHGYIIIAPYHLDGGGSLRAIFNSVRKGNMGLIQARVDDVQLILDQLDKLDGISPGLNNRIDHDRLAVTGHSFGAFTAQQFAGAQAIDHDSGEVVKVHGARIKAVVAISPPGEMFGVINAESWKGMNIPMLATTGTWDVDGHFVTQWQQHKLSFDSAKPGQNWLLVSQGADHYFGNLICRPDREEAPQTDALNMANATVVNFLQAHLYDDKNAQALLNSNTLQELSNGFSSLQHR
ncbi:MAG: alpha/beta hydrolase family protein [Oceanococcus sp.]